MDNTQTKKNFKNSKSYGIKIGNLYKTFPGFAYVCVRDIWKRSVLSFTSLATSLIPVFFLAAASFLMSKNISAHPLQSVALDLKMMLCKDFSNFITDNIITLKLSKSHKLARQKRSSRYSRLEVMILYPYALMCKNEWWGYGLENQTHTKHKGTCKSHPCWRVLQHLHKGRAF